MDWLTMSVCLTNKKITRQTWWYYYICDQPANTTLLCDLIFKPTYLIIFWTQSFPCQFFVRQIVSKCDSVTSSNGGRDQRFDSLLQQPITRITRYELLLKDLAKWMVGRLVTWICAAILLVVRVGVLTVGDTGRYPDIYSEVLVGLRGVTNSSICHS